MGGGVLLELSHEFDYLNYIFGDFNWIQSYVAKDSSLDVNVEDSAYILGNIEINKLNKRHFDCTAVVSIEMDFYNWRTHRYCEVIFDEATVVWNVIDSTVKVYSRNSDYIYYDAEGNDNSSYYNQLVHILFEYHDNNSEFEHCTFHEGVKTLEIISAIRESSNLDSMRIILKD
jgi:predicted dehydrogenase